ncbi:hypothetical protein [Anaerobiospirillum sp. NML120511]|uniref:hypothetical protein n=1 Tax=Anaerobiospirillum sp. NML120511 TaxID=2932819 RepID=UPI001FF16A2D|nr:hypothetical protein [Anaerobiospirillum sp. NML120511]MCK0534126.1 hypothetical protein [Anaerobiospirillum sp. NML120511]
MMRQLCGANVMLHASSAGHDEQVLLAAAMAAQVAAGSMQSLNMAFCCPSAIRPA